MLKIGNTELTLTNLPYEANDAVNIDESIQASEKQSPHGYFVIRYTGQRRSTYEISYSELSKEEYEQITQYCDQPKKYYVLYTNTQGTEVFKGLAYLFKSGMSVDKDARLYSINLTVRLT